MVENSPLTKAHVAALFAPQDRQQAEELLANECAENLPLLADATPKVLERVRFAALRLSEGSLPGLREAIVLAKTDWRDLLVAAGFADDVEAHRRWKPKR